MFSVLKDKYHGHVRVKQKTRVDWICITPLSWRLEIAGRKGDPWAFFGPTFLFLCVQGLSSAFPIPLTFPLSIVHFEYRSAFSPPVSGRSQQVVKFLSFVCIIIHSFEIFFGTSNNTKARPRVHEKQKAADASSHGCSPVCQAASSLNPSNFRNQFRPLGDPHVLHYVALIYVNCNCSTVRSTQSSKSSIRSSMLDLNNLKTNFSSVA